MTTASGTFILRSAHTNSLTLVVLKAYAPVTIHGSIILIPTASSDMKLSTTPSAAGTSHISAADSIRYITPNFIAPLNLALSINGTRKSTISTTSVIKFT